MKHIKKFEKWIIPDEVRIRESRNTKINSIIGETVGPIQLQKVTKVDGGYVLSTEKGDFTIREENKENLGIKYIPKEGYNYTFEVVDKEIKKVIFQTVDLLIVAENKILLIKRKNDPFKGKWANPGGFIDEGEEAIEAAVRELEEETSLKLNEEDLTYVGKFDKEWRDPRNKYSITYAYRANLPSIKDVKAKDDAEEAEWIPLDDIEDLDMAFDHKDIIKSTINNFDTN